MTTAEQTELQKMKAQRDELAEALRQSLGELQSIHLQYGDMENAREHSAAIVLAEKALAKLEDDVVKPDNTLKSKIGLCPKCGSGDVDFCNISVRPHCNECDYWLPAHFGTAEQAITKWNALMEDAK